MNFLNPLVLWALPVFLAPLVLHFLHKKPPRKLFFSSVSWIKQAHHKTMPKKKLKEVLLLIVRMLLLLFLILFFSRPILQKSFLNRGEDDQQVTMLLMDVSASMGAVSNGLSSLDNAKRIAQEVIKKSSAGQKIGLLVYSDRIEKEIAPTAERSLPLSSVQALKETPGSTEIFPAIKQATQILTQHSKAKKSVLILSDQAQNGWKTAIQEAGRWEGYDPEIQWFVCEVSPFQSNSGVSDAQLQLNQEGVLIGNARFFHEGKTKDLESWSFLLGDQTVGQGPLSFNSLAEMDVSLRTKFPLEGHYSGVVKKSADFASFDDQFFVAGRAPRKFRLLVVDGEGGLAPSDAESYYLKTALESPRDPRLESLRVLRPETLIQEDFSNYDVIVMANVADWQGRETDLRKWVETGGGLFLTAGNQWPSSKGDLLGIFRPQGIIREKRAIKPPNAKELFLSGVPNLDQFEWNQIVVHQYVRLFEDSSFTSILQLSEGDPLLLRKQIGKGNVVVLTTTLDRTWTNFPTKPAFSPIMRDLVSILADPLRQQSSLSGFVREPFRTAISPSIRNINVVSPDGFSVPLRPSREGWLEYPSPEQPGLYYVKTDKKETDFFFAINIPHIREEGKLTRVTEAELSSAFPGAFVQWIAYQSKTEQVVARFLQGKDLTSLLLFLILACFILETILGWPYRTFKVFAAITFIFLLCSGEILEAAAGNKFVYAQLKYEGAWDPYPGVEGRVLQTLQQMTNIPFQAERKTVTLLDDALFDSGFLLVKGNSTLRFSADEKRQLKLFIDRGGFVFFDDTLADARGPFAQSVRSLMGEIYPDRPFQKLNIDHALFRSFFLLRNVSGRRISQKALEGIDVGGSLGGEGRTAVIFCPNDLMGTWMKDNLGEYLFSCEPGGETQRWEALKLTVNIIYFSLTGTYKRDAIHQPFIEMKLGS